MTCPHCGSDVTFIEWASSEPGGIIRRGRICQSCEGRFETEEERDPETLETTVSEHVARHGRP